MPECFRGEFITMYAIQISLPLPFLLKQPLDFYEPYVLPATQPIMSKHYRKTQWFGRLLVVVILLLLLIIIICRITTVDKCYKGQPEQNSKLPRRTTMYNRTQWTCFDTQALSTNYTEQGLARALRCYTIQVVDVPQRRNCFAETTFCTICFLNFGSFVRQNGRWKLLIHIVKQENVIWSGITENTGTTVV